MTNGAADALADWLTLRGDARGKIFLPIRKGGEIQHRPLTAQGVYAMLKTRARQSGVAEFSPHDLRRTCTGDLLEAGNDLSAVASYLGHQSVTTTQRYDRRGERAKMRAVGSLSVPYRRAE